MASQDESVNVLKYWFEGDLNRNYKEKWFPSDDQQKIIDYEINTKFSTLLTKSLNKELDTWKEAGIISNMALIIVLDQFSRHIFRYQNRDKGDPLRHQADAQAIECAEYLVATSGWCDEIPCTWVIFALMPFRHSPNVERLQFVLKMIDYKEVRDSQACVLLNKFRKQTVTRLQRIAERAKAEVDDYDILERAEFEANEETMKNEILVLTMKTFLVGQFAPLNCSSDIFISLSGGVDSMVITKILIYLRNECLLPITKIVAIHIDYANRDESKAEADFVQSYCEKHRVHFEKRVINEVTRGVTDRSQYEKIAREIRYGFYLDILKKHSTGTIGCVIFGHHMGDVQENVLSNVMRGNSPLELSGMSSVGLVNGVSVWRPLLNHTKEDIFSFAHKYGIPYFKDTTPSWSTRGKLRNQLVPLLIDMYGAGCLRNLSLLAAASDELRETVHENIYDPFLRSVEYFACGLKVCVLPFKDRSVRFWKEILKLLMHSMGMSLVREGAVSSLLDRLHPLQQLPRQQNIIRNGDIQSNRGSVGSGTNAPDHQLIPGWIELRKGFHSYLTPTGYLIIFREGVLFNYESLFNSKLSDRSIRSTSKRKKKEKKLATLGNAANISTVVTEAVMVEAEEDFSVENLFVLPNEDTNFAFAYSSAVSSRSLSDNISPTSLSTDSVDESTLEAEITNNGTEKGKLCISTQICDLRVSSMAVVAQVQVSGWQITVQKIRSEDIKAPETKSLLTDPSEVLSGQFSYSAQIPLDNAVVGVDLVVYSYYKYLANNSQHLHGRGEEEELVTIRDLSMADLKLRLSLPILVPVIRKKEDCHQSLNLNIQSVNLKFSLEFMNL